MTTVDPRTIERTPEFWTSPKGFNKQSVPWRLWEKAKEFFWDPAKIDFSKDVEDWSKLEARQKLQVGGLARGFMVGEEGVTLDIVPLMMAMADQGRAEEALYLTSFTFEEAKHVDFFRRWFDAIGLDPNPEGLAPLYEEAGLDQPPRQTSGGMFEKELPRVMRRLIDDNSPEAVLDASVTYNQFIEGVLAISGYKVWAQIFASFGTFPGLQEGLRHVRRDEGRHITYGTYLCQRLIAADNSLADAAVVRMNRLKDGYFEAQQQGQGGGYGASGGGNGQGGNGQQGEGNGQGGPLGAFAQYALEQVDRRIAILEKARTLKLEDVERGGVSEETEAEFDHVRS